MTRNPIAFGIGCIMLSSLVVTLGFALCFALAPGWLVAFALSAVAALLATITATSLLMWGHEG